MHKIVFLIFFQLLFFQCSFFHFHFCYIFLAFEIYTKYFITYWFWWNLTGNAFLGVELNCLFCVRKISDMESRWEKLLGSLTHSLGPDLLKYFGIPFKLFSTFYSFFYQAGPLLNFWYFRLAFSVVFEKTIWYFISFLGIVFFVWDLTDLSLSILVVRPLSIKRIKLLDYQFYRELLIVCSLMIGITSLLVLRDLKIWWKCSVFIRVLNITRLA